MSDREHTIEYREHTIESALLFLKDHGYNHEGVRSAINSLRQRAEERTAMRGLGKAIRIFRAARGLDQTQLSQLTGLDPTSLYNIESETRKPSLEALDQIAKGLGVKPWVLMLMAEGKPDKSVPLVEAAAWKILEELLK